jgi:6-phosphogluconolactonase
LQKSTKKPQKQSKIMTKAPWKSYIRSTDTSRDVIIPGSKEETLDFSVEQFLFLAAEAIAQEGKFLVALSGGSTPKAIYELLAQSPESENIEWDKVYLFWSDERSVPPTDPESNYKMAMDSGLSKLPIPKENIFRMKAEKDIEANAKHYEEEIKKLSPKGSFDLVMLGMGEDGHTASLFPKTHALHTSGQLVVGNFVPQKNTWRMTLTYSCIDAAKNTVIYVLGKSKAEMVKKIFTTPLDPDTLPIQRIGIPSRKALWVLDDEAASEIISDSSLFT